MFLTVTPNPALDKNLLIDEWTPGTPIHAKKLVSSIGGKGLDASVALRHLGQETCGLHFAAGPAGQELLRLVRDYGITPEVIWVQGETRTAYIVAEERTRRHTHIFSGQLVLRDADVDAFLERYGQLLPEALWVLTGGVLAPDLSPAFFRTLVERAAAARVPILVDSMRRALLECLPAFPDVVKMNRNEFGWTFETDVSDRDRLRMEARRVVQERRLRRLVITCGDEGMLGIGPEGTFFASPPRVQVANAVGAGDAASAAIAWRLASGDTWPEVLRWATAVSAASVLTEGTSDVRIKDVEAILPQVTVAHL